LKYSFIIFFDTDEDINEAQCQLIVRKRTYVDAVTKDFKKAVIDSGCEVHSRIISVPLNYLPLPIVVWKLKLQAISME
jgi:hypothetical protein